MITVTDTMTEAALRQWYGTGDRIRDFRNSRRTAMREAIEAALKADAQEKAAEVAQ